MAENNGFAGISPGMIESAVSLVVLVVVLAVVLEVLKNVPAIDLIETNPLGFVIDVLADLTDADGNGDGSGNGGLL